VARKDREEYPHERSLTLVLTVALADAHRLPGTTEMHTCDAIRQEHEVVEVDGQRQVFLTQYRSATSDEDVRELQAILDSIHIET